MIDEKIKALPSHPFIVGERQEYVPSRPVRRLDSGPAKPGVSWADLIRGDPAESPEPHTLIQEATMETIPVDAPKATVVITPKKGPWPPKVTIPKPGSMAYRVVHFLYTHGETDYGHLLRQVGAKHNLFRELLRKLIMEGRIVNLHVEGTIPEGRFAVSETCQSLFVQLAIKEQESAKEAGTLVLPVKKPAGKPQASPQAGHPSAATKPGEQKNENPLPTESVPPVDLDQDTAIFEERMVATLSDLESLLRSLSQRANKAEKFMQSIQALVKEYGESCQ